MNVDVDGLRAVAEAATAGLWWASEWPERRLREPGDEVYWSVGSNPQVIVAEVGLNNDASNAAYIAAARPEVVIGLLDRLQAAEAAVERLERRVADTGFDPLDVFRSDRGPGEHERQGYLDGLRTAARIVRTALDGSQDAATGEVALGSTDDPQGPQIASGAETDNGDRREGEGLA